MSPNNCITVNDVGKIMQRYDVIVSRSAVFKDSISNILDQAPSIDDMNAVKEAISELYPSYLNDYSDFMNGNEYYPYNMTIMKRNDYSKYCEWLFSILTYVEDHYGNPYTDNYRSRLFGFLSERLLYVWVNHNFKKERIKQLKVLYTEENLIKSNYHMVASVLKKFIFRLKKLF